MWLLVVASFHFYAAWNASLAFLVTATASVDYVLARFIERAGNRRVKFALMWTSVAMNLGVLAYFKYRGFFLNELHRPGFPERRTGPPRRAGPRGMGRGADHRGSSAGARAPGRRVAPGRYQILAAINAVHTSARDVRDTDWSQVVALYDQLVRLDPSPIIALNRAIAVAELDGPEVALAAVDRLEDKLAGYHAYHATRADLLRRLGRSQKSRAAYDKAIELAGNTAETAYLTRRRDQLG